MYRLYVFDLDGTLIDSRRDIADSANALLTACGARPLPAGEVGRMVGEGVARLVARAFAAAGIDPPADAVEQFLGIYDRHLLDHTRPYPDMAEVLDGLSQRGALALLTNKPLTGSRTILAGLNLARYFEEGAVVGGDGPFARKPDPSALRHLIDRAGASAGTTVLVGDSLVDWQTARNGGTAFCLARYGFGAEAFPMRELSAGSHVVASPIDLLTL